MVNHNDEFTDVNDFVPNWNPRTKGSKKDGNQVKLPAGDDSWIIGFYLNSREQRINNDNYTIHKIRVTACGNHEHLGAELKPEGTDFEFFGTHVVNETLKDPSKVMPGQRVRIQWLGLKQPEKEGARPYQNWKIGVDHSATPLNVKNGVVISDSNSSHHDIISDNDPMDDTIPFDPSDDDELFS